jgi:glycerophosphoryl diester phosphodiesterase
MWPYPRVVAHRGGGTLAPENTLAALVLARNLGFRAVEFDAKLSRDGKLILMHDDTLDRTTDGTGAVADQDYAALSKLDAGSWFGNEYVNEPVPALAAASALCRQIGLWANIEIKPCPGLERATGQAVAREVALLWAGADLLPIVSSFSAEALEAARVQAPEIPRGMLFDQVPTEWREILQQLECVSLHANYKRLSQPLIEEIHAAGYGVLAYTVNDSEVGLDLAQWQVDALCTDALETITPAFL